MVDAKEMSITAALGAGTPRSAQRTASITPTSGLSANTYSHPPLVTELA